MSEITDDDIAAMVKEFEYERSGSNAIRGPMLVAARTLLARHPERHAQRPMHEPASKDEKRRAINLWFREAKKDDSVLMGMADDMGRVLDDFLAGRAAPQRVVVTADAVDRVGRRIFGSTWLRVSKMAEDVRAALEEFLAGAHEKPVDPRVAELTEICIKSGLTAEQARAAAVELVAHERKLGETKP